MANTLGWLRASLLSAAWAGLTFHPAWAGDVPAVSSCQPSPPDASGYVAVKMIRIKESTDRFVEMTADGHKLKMLIDTGCDDTILHTEAAERVGLKWGEGLPQRSLKQTLSVGYTY